MNKEIINPQTLPEPRGFNHGIIVEGGRTVYLAGQDASDVDGNIVAPNDLVAQFEQVMANLETVLAEAGGSTRDIVKLHVFVADRDDYLNHLSELGEIFQRYIDIYPTMALFEVNGFYREDALIELEGVAHLQHGTD